MVTIWLRVCDRGRVNLRPLLDLLDGVGALCRVVDDAGAELRVRHRREREANSENGEERFAELHKQAPFR